VTGDKRHSIENNVEIIIIRRATLGDAMDNSDVKPLSCRNKVLISFHCAFHHLSKFDQKKGKKVTPSKPTIAIGLLQAFCVLSQLPFLPTRARLA
jgi:hypothetical protein